MEALIFIQKLSRSPLKCRGIPIAVEDLALIHAITIDSSFFPVPILRHKAAVLQDVNNCRLASQLAEQSGSLIDSSPVVADEAVILTEPLEHGVDPAIHGFATITEETLAVSAMLFE